MTINRFFKPQPLKGVREHIYVDDETGVIIYSKWRLYTPATCESFAPTGAELVQKNGKYF